MQFSCGVIPNVRAKGKGAVRVADILIRMQTKEPVNTSNVNDLSLQSQDIFNKMVDHTEVNTDSILLQNYRWAFQK